MLLPRDGGWLRYNYGKVKWGCWWWMKSNEDVDWGVIFSVASACVQHRRFWTEAGEWYVYEPSRAHTFHAFIQECTSTHRRGRGTWVKCLNSGLLTFLTSSSAKVWEDRSWETIHVVVPTCSSVLYPRMQSTLFVSFTRYFSTVLSRVERVTPRKMCLLLSSKI